MKKIALVLIGCLTLGTAEQANAERFLTANPQIKMGGARSESLGGTVPTLEKDITAVMLNPASIGGLEYTQISLTHQNVLGIPYYTLGVAMPSLWGYTVGVTLGSNMTNDLQETALDNDAIQPIGTFAAGYYVLNTSVAKQLPKLFFLDNVSLGAGVKWYLQTIGGSARNAFGLDVGLIGTYPMKNDWMSDLTIGLSVLNLLSSPIRGSEAFAQQYILGSRFNTYQKRLAIFTQTEFQVGRGNLFNQLSLGAEYSVTNEFTVRGGATYQGLSRDYIINLGTGLALSDIGGYTSSEFLVNINYNLGLNVSQSNLDPVHTISIFLSGQNRPLKPSIISPKEPRIITNDPTLEIRGEAPANTQVTVFNNQLEAITRTSDNRGNWIADEFRLQEGDNVIYAKTFALEGQSSLDSNSISVHLDTRPPHIQDVILVSQNDIDITIQASEPLKVLNGTLNNTKIPFEKKGDSTWKAVVKLPASLFNNAYITDSASNVLTISGQDIAGNASNEITKLILLQITEPLDKTETIESELMIRGQISEEIRSLSINTVPVEVTQNGLFSLQQPLKLGKNLLTVQATDTKGAKRNYFIRVLRLKSYDDLYSTSEDRQIQYLATLGLFPNTPEFGGNTAVSKLEFAELVGKLLAIPESRATRTDFADIPDSHPDAGLIQVLADRGIIEPESTGNFEPNMAITQTQAMEILKRAQIVPATTPLTGASQPMTRTMLAQLLAQVPSITEKISILQNWSVGYN